MTREEFERLPRDAENRSALHRAFGNMHARCNAPSRADLYAGKKGVTVCDEWSGEQGWYRFRDWAIPLYQPGLTLDRIDNDGDYCPDNCRFISIKEQQRNKTNNRVIQIGTTKKCLAEWCEIFGLQRACFYARLARGWDELTALTEPPRYAAG